MFAQLVDDPSARPELFPTEENQARERQRLFGIIEELVKWENTTNETVLEEAREEIRKSWWRTCEDNKDHPRADELFNPDKLPAFHDPFAGGGSIPLVPFPLEYALYRISVSPVNHSYPRNRESRVRGSFTVSTNLSGNGTSITTTVGMIG